MEGLQKRRTFRKQRNEDVAEIQHQIARIHAREDNYPYSLTIVTPTINAKIFFFSRGEYLERSEKIAIDQEDVKSID